MIAFGIILFPFVTAVLSGVSRVYGAAFLLAILPTYQIRGEIMHIPVTALELSLFAFLGFVALDLLRRERKPRWGEAQLLVLLFLAVATAAVLSSQNTGEALGFWKAFFLEPILFFLAVVNIVRDAKQLQALFVGLGTGVAVIGLASFWQAVGILPAALPYAEETPARLSSVFPYPNAVALLVVPVVLLLMPFVLSHLQERRTSVFIYGSVLFGVFALLLSVSEAGFFGFFAGLIVLLLLTKRFRFLYVVLLLVLFVVLAVPAVRDQVVALASFSDTSADVRLRLWGGTARLLQAHPITGAGLAGFPDLYDQYRDAAHVELLLFPHSFLLNFWTELGLAGVLLILVLLFQFFRRVRRSMPQPYEAYRVSVFAAMVGLLVHGLFDVPYFKNDLALLFWTLLAFAVVLESFSRRSQRSMR